MSIPGGLTNKYPYTDYEKINLDWIFTVLKEAIEILSRFEVDESLNSESMHAIANKAVCEALNNKLTVSSDGIVTSQMSEPVQRALSLAISALQSVPPEYRTAVAQDAIDAAKQDVLLEQGNIGDIVTVESVDTNNKPTGYYAMPNTFIRYVAQLLSAGQKEAARNNIGAQEVMINSGADIGDILQIAAIDGTGRPTEWAAVKSTVKKFHVRNTVSRNWSTTNPFIVNFGVPLNWFLCNFMFPSAGGNDLSLKVGLGNTTSSTTGNYTKTGLAISTSSRRKIFIGSALFPIATSGTTLFPVFYAPPGNAGTATNMTYDISYQSARFDCFTYIQIAPTSSGSQYALPVNAEIDVIGGIC